MSGERKILIAVPFCVQCGKPAQFVLVAFHHEALDTGAGTIVETTFKPLCITCARETGMQPLVPSALVQRALGERGPDTGGMN